MKYKVIVLSLFLLLSLFISSSEAQNDDDDSWKIMLHIQGGVFGNGRGTTIEERFVDYYYNEKLGHYEFVSIDFTTNSKYKTGVLLYGGFEVSKGYIGFQGNFGFTPANMRVAGEVTGGGITVSPEREQSITSFYVEGVFLFFPTGSGVGKTSPYLAIGVGGCCKLQSEPDIEDVGYLISFGGGMRIFFKKKYGMIMALKAYYMDFGDFYGWSGGSFIPIQGTAGLIYCF